MADVVIRGMEIPKEPTYIAIFPDGSWYDYTEENSYGKFVVLPEDHGRLVDADAIDTTWCDPEVDIVLSEAPTILEAEGVGKDE